MAMLKRSLFRHRISVVNHYTESLAPCTLEPLAGSRENFLWFRFHKMMLSTEFNCSFMYVHGRASAVAVLSSLSCAASGFGFPLDSWHAESFSFLAFGLSTSK